MNSSARTADLETLRRERERARVEFEDRAAEAAEDGSVAANQAVDIAREKFERLNRAVAVGEAAERGRPRREQVARQADDRRERADARAASQTLLAAADTLNREIVDLLTSAGEKVKERAAIASQIKQRIEPFGSLDSEILGLVDADIRSILHAAGFSGHLVPFGVPTPPAKLADVLRHRLSRTLDKIERILKPSEISSK
jgi:hypothetical protein